MKAKELLQTKISYYNNVKYNKSYKTITLYEWITKYSIQNKSNIDVIRQQYEIDKSKAKKMKANNLPCVTMTGVFEDYRRVDLVSKINSIFVVDIDKDDNPNIIDWEELKYRIAKLPYVFLTSYSCSGKGIYCIIYFNNSLNIEHMFNALQKDFKNIGVNIDNNCKDITRLRFVSYDDNILIRQNDVEMYNKSLIIEKHIYNNSIGQINEQDDFIYQAIFHLITKCNYRSNKYCDWLQDAFRLATFGKYGYILFMLLSQLSDNYDEQKAKEKFIECQKKTRYNKSSLVYYFSMLKNYYGNNWKQIIKSI